jgi:hypothetical protein
MRCGGPRGRRTAMDSTNVSIPPMSTDPVPAGSPLPSPQAAPPAAPVAAPATPVHAAPASGGERCLGCGAHVAADQRYCLECGQRRGEPRLPFMDASSFMETAAQRRQPAAPPPPPRRKRQRISPNAALIAGVGTLLLALGIGVLIGRSGNQGSAPAAAAPQIIKVGGGGESTPTTASTGGSSGGSAKKKSGGGNAKAASKTGSSGQTAAAEEVLKPTAAAGKLPPPVVKPGDKGSGRGYSKSGEFNGNFFGE